MVHERCLVIKDPLPPPFIQFFKLIKVLTISIVRLSVVKQGLTLFIISNKRRPYVYYIYVLITKPPLILTLYTVVIVC